MRKRQSEELSQAFLGGYQNVEIIVINDGSTDDTEQLVREISDKDNRVKVISQQNCGVGVAKSRGVRESTGDYIAFCDSDDWFEFNYLQEHIAHLKEYNADISMCRTQISNCPDTGNSNELIIKDTPNIVSDYLHYSGITVSLWDKVFKRCVLDLDEIENDYRYSEDLFMNYVACKYAKRFVYFNTTKYNWFNNVTSLSRGRFNPVKLECDFASWKRIIDDCHKNHPELEENARLSSEMWICGTYRYTVTCHFHDKEMEDHIAKYIRQDGIKVLGAEKNCRNKIFLVFAYFSFPLARYVWYLMNGIKKVIKELLKK